MHRMVILLEGAADLPHAGFRGRTPLDVARLPNLSRWTAEGTCGVILQDRPRGGEAPRSLMFDMLGLDHPEISTASTAWAATQGDHRPGCGIFRGSFVTVADHVLFDPDLAISFDETLQLAQAVQAVITDLDIELVVPTAGQVLICIHIVDDIPRLPTGRAMRNRHLRDELHVAGSERLNTFYRRTVEVLADHSINEVRLDLGENPANALWPWDGGRSAAVADSDAGGVVLGARFGSEGAARLAGWEHVPIRSPYQMDTDGAAFELPVLVDAFRRHKNSLVYVDSPRILGNFGDSSRKVKALDLIDYHLFGPLFTLLEAQRPLRLLVVTDGLVLSTTGLPASGRLPLLVVGDGRPADPVERFAESSCAEGSLGTIERGMLHEMLWAT